MLAIRVTRLPGEDVWQADGCSGDFLKRPHELTLLVGRNKRDSWLLTRAHSFDFVLYKRKLKTATPHQSWLWVFRRQIRLTNLTTVQPNGCHFCLGFRHFTLTATMVSSQLTLPPKVTSFSIFDVPRESKLKWWRSARSVRFSNFSSRSTRDLRF